LRLSGIPKLEAPENHGIPAGCTYLGEALGGLTFSVNEPLDGSDRWALGNSFKNLYRLQFVETEIIKARRPVSKTQEDKGVSSLPISSQELEILVDEAIRLQGTDIHIDFSAAPRLRLRVNQILEDYKLPVDLERLRRDIDALNGEDHFETRMAKARINTVPTARGVKAVIRVFPKTRKIPTLQCLGFSVDDTHVIQKAVTADKGLIVFSGPTGSGKTATICAALAEIIPTNTQKVVSVENPIEIIIPGVSQIQVNNNSEMAARINQALRADPDCIIIGDVCDCSTTTLAVQAAITGHTVIAGMYAKSCKEALDILVKTQDAPMLLADSLSLIVNQRLISKPCPNCRVAEPLPAKFKKYLPEYLYADKVTHTYRGEGCRLCRHTGFQGRTLAVEILPVTRSIRKYILGELSWDEATPKDFKSIAQATMEKCLCGLASLTTLEEIIEEGQ